MRAILLSVLFLLTLTAYAQTNTYLADLAALKSIVQKTASYKAQIRGEERAGFEDLYNRLASVTVNSSGNYKYFYNLARLLFLVQDNHLGFYQVPDYRNFRTKDAIDSFVSTKPFLDYPTSPVNIDSLKVELARKPAESVEGIYHYDRFYRVGVFQSGSKEFVGVILDSDVNLWTRGQIAIHLYETAPGMYKAIYGHPLSKNFILQPVEKYHRQSLLNSTFYASYSQSIYSKQLNSVDNVNLKKDASRFEFRNINDSVQYLLVRSFQNNATTTKASQKFYDSIKTLLKAPHLIVDLRNNEGGAEREAKRYLKLFRQYIKQGRLYVLINNGTLSQAELLTLELKRLKNVTLVGEQTRGMLSYGSNYGSWQKLPSGRFAVYTTDMTNGRDVLPYENHGIKPHIMLEEESDWIKQIVEIIRRN